jgi:hypothetical protein
MLEEMFEDLIFESNTKFSKNMKSNDNLREGKAFITGSFTNWEPRRML